MKHPIQRLASGPKPFWKRILERHQSRSAFPRRRVALVLFRFWAPRERPEQTGMRPQVMQTAISLNLQLSWPQWISKVSGFREVFTHSVTKVTPSVIKELKQVKVTSLQEPSKTDGKTGTRHDGQSRSPIPVPSSTPLPGGAPMGSVQLPTERIQRASPLSSSLNVPAESQDSRFFSRRILNNEFNSVLFERNSFVTSLARLNEFTHKRSGDLARARSSPAFANAGILQEVSQRDRVARLLRRNVQATPMQSLLSQPALTEMQQNPLLRSRLFAEAAWLNLASQPTSVAAAAHTDSRETSPPRPPDVAQPPPQQLDIGRLSDEVYRHIQRKIRIERERRGM